MVYSDKGTFYTNKSMCQSLSNIYRNLVELDSPVLEMSGVVIPPTKFYFMCMPKCKSCKYEYVPVFFLHYSEAREKRIDNFFLKYPALTFYTLLLDITSP